LFVSANIRLYSLILIRSIRIFFALTTINLPTIYIDISVDFEQMFIVQSIASEHERERERKEKLIQNINMYAAAAIVIVHIYNLNRSNVGRRQEKEEWNVCQCSGTHLCCVGSSKHRIIKANIYIDRASPSVYNIFYIRARETEREMTIWLRVYVWSVTDEYL
jgi:hypothetical protein